MRISQLEAFVAVYNFRSLTRAAVDLHVSQPALTKTIRLLEQELGVRLFDRCPRGVEATIYGHALAPHAKSISAEYRNTRSQLSAIASGQLGSVRIGAGPYVIGDIIPSAVTSVVARHRELRIEIVTGSNEYLVGAVESGDIELCIVSKPREGQLFDLATIELTRNEYAVIARAEHPLVGASQVRLAEIVGFPWIFIGRNFAATSHLAPILRAHQLEFPQTVTETDSVTYLISHLRKSNCLSYQPRQLIDASQAVGSLRPIDVPEAAHQFPLVIFHRKNGLLSPGARELIRELRGLVLDRSPRPMSASERASRAPGLGYRAAKIAARVAKGADKS
jgi:DNA-binding transcriptional LysR family regulator